jgi:hypothetical protein
MKKETLSTSEKEIPKTVLGLEEKYKEEAKTSEPNKEPLNPENIKAVVDELPTPSGWRILVLPFTPKEKTSGGLIIAQESLDRLRIATNCGYVLKIGPLAYFDKEKYVFIPLLIVLLITTGFVRTQNIPQLKDVFTGEYTLGPDLDPFLYLRHAKEILNGEQLLLSHFETH